MTNRFETLIDQHREKIFEPIRQNIPTGYPEKHYEMVSDYPQRQGKYIRPGLVLLSTKLFGGNIENAIITAAAMQCSEDWILIHDDIEDQSEVRRNEPTLHKKYGLEHALNAGDTLHMVMWKILMANRTVLGYEKTFELFDEMNAFLLTTAEGQYLELSWIKDKNLTLSEEDYYRMVDRKTGWYTIIGPLRLGARIANVSDRTLEQLVKFGIPLGRAFQIHDDWLNIYGKNIGKESYGDIFEGKRTLLLIHTLNNANEKEREFIKKIYTLDRKDKTQEMVDEIRDIMNKYSTKEEIRKKTENYATESLKELEKIETKDNEAKEILKDAIDYIVNRGL